MAPPPAETTQELVFIHEAYFDFPYLAGEKEPICLVTTEENGDLVFHRGPVKGDKIARVSFPPNEPRHISWYGGSSHPLQDEIRRPESSYPYDSIFILSFRI